MKISNSDLAQKMIQALTEAGVSEWVVCAGARNAPLVTELYRTHKKIYNFFEERSAAFFALGRIKKIGRPVAVVTTSGTAVAELYPSIIEAHYSGYALIAVTADRPKRFRNSGAPQSIEQRDIFAHYAPTLIDVDDVPAEILNLSPHTPTHINICFEEPQNERVVPLVTRESGEFKNPLVIVSTLCKDEHEEVRSFLRTSKLPVYLEAVSGLRGEAEFQKQALTFGADRLTPELFLKNFDSVIRIGGVPTLRLWRDLELSLMHIPVQSFCRTPFSGLSRVKSQSRPLSDLKKLNFNVRHSHKELFDLNENLSLFLNTCLKEFPQSEPGFFYRLSQQIPYGANVFLGNSLPIREWDLAADESSKSFHYISNRGANGIDGLVSTFLGAIDSERENWIILGDLSALYDLAALWALDFYPTETIRIVVINNAGGRIFSKVFKDKNFENEHQLNFKSWAEMFKINYYLVKNEFPKIESRIAVIEVQPDSDATSLFWQMFETKK